MPKKRLKTYLSIPVFLGMLALPGQVSADEVAGSSSATANDQTANTTTPPSTANTTNTVDATEPVTYQVSDTALTVTYNRPLAPHSQVLYAIWSDRRGQDDYYWYPANADGSATISFDNHADYGVYNLHTYTNTAGRLEAVSTDTFEREQPGASPSAAISVTEPGRALVEVTDYREDKTNFTVKVTGQSPDQALTGVQVAVWSKNQGQDDIRWYEPAINNQSASVKVRIADHANQSDRYAVHVYTSYADGKVIGTNLGDFQITKPAPTEPARVELFDYQENKNDFTVRVVGSEDTKEIADVRVAVWSHDKGQDDIRWYEPAISNNQASVTINSSNHSRKTDNYTVHVYTTYTDGTTQGTNLGNLKIIKTPELTDAKAEVIDYAPNKTEFTVRITGSEETKTVQSVRIGVWSEANGRDDLKWYTPAVSNNQASVTVSIADHSNTSDKYRVHVYTTYTDQTIKETDLGAFAITKPAPTGHAKAEVIGYRADKPEFSVLVSSTEETKPIQNVRIAVWSEGNGQDDLKWYTPMVVNNQAIQTISVTNHSNTSDRYNVHVYTTYQDGETVGSNLGAYPITVTKAQPTTSASQGRYDVINRIIYLDAGHGGSDPGAVYGVNEKDLNLSIQRQLKARLEAAGYQVVTTRTTDRYMDLLDRSRAANASLSDLFVSIHFNASTNRSIEGIETYHYQYFPEYPARINAYHDNAARQERSTYLATAIHAATVGQTQAVNRGIHRKTFAVLRETTAPSVLLELGYMSNPSENAKIVQAAYQSKLVEGIFQGIQAYYRRYS